MIAMPPLPARLRRLIRYGITGLFVNGLAYCLFLGLIGLADARPVQASGLCYGAAALLGYLINRHWTFASRQGHRRDLPRFLAAHAVGLAVTLATMAVLAGPLGPALAQLVCLCLAALAIYASLLINGFGGSDVRRQPAHVE